MLRLYVTLPVPYHLASMDIYEYTKKLTYNHHQSRTVVQSASAHPTQKILCGFSRRFDTSYRAAYTRVSSGAIGTPTIVRSQTCDKLDPSGFFVNYAEASGGIFVDCNIHDIDLALWFLGSRNKGGEELRPKSVYAVGVTAVQPGLAEHGDVDNGLGIVEFFGGKIAHFYSSRMMAAGQHDETEIIGTKGKISVNARPAVDLVEVHEAGGIRREIPQDYFGRFEEAFVREGVEWTDCCLEDKTLPFGLGSAVRALEIGVALQESLRSGKKIEFTEGGERVV
jgi:myo-inositol 2-dehydrogenase / D-chiro-inositol 1-dehydrogenase